MPRTLHDLVLRQATMRIRVHGIPTGAGRSTAGSEILDIMQVKRSATVLVALELRNRCLGRRVAVEADNTSATGSAAGLVLNLGLLNFTDGRKQLDEILVTSGPGKLYCVSDNSHKSRQTLDTHVAHVNGLARVGSSSGVVREGVRGYSGDNAGASIVPTAGTAGTTSTTRSTTAVSTSAVAPETTTSPTKPTTAAVATSEATTATKAAAATEAKATTHSRASKAVLANLELATLPIIAVELLDSVPGVVGVLEHDDT
jgi:hypothetical protein